MAKLINNTNSTGPYPGRTWKQEAAAKRAPNGGECLFPYAVMEQLEVGTCDYLPCGKKVGKKYHYCSKACADNAEREARDEAEAEARVS
jgi:hypothetical protein